MNLFANDFTTLNAPPAIAINLQQKTLYSEQYSYLTKDELEVLFLFATTSMSMQGSTSYSFSGLKRQLGKHQQKVTKAINRLLSKGFISKNGDNGYSISRKGRSVLAEIVQEQNAVNLHQSLDRYYEQRLVFEPPISLSEIGSIFIGKWFGSFRYLSHSQNKDSFVIRWQIVESKTIASFTISHNEGIITIFPIQNKNKRHQKATEVILQELSQFIFDSLEAIDIIPSITSEGWRKNRLTELDYEQKLMNWLSNFRPEYSEN
jgi:DNA-binding MarR family transcriptional regulator